MLSIFPSLLAYSLLAPLILRVVVGCVFVVWGWKHVYIQSSGTTLWWRGFGVLEFAGGILLILGAWTQIATLMLMILSALLFFIHPTQKHNLAPLLLFFISLSLLIAGPGLFAFDLPL